MGDLLMQTVYTLSQLAYQRLGADPPDLAQARLGIDALAALVPVLDVPDQTRRDLEQMVTNLKLSYAKVATVAPPEPKPEPEPEPQPGTPPSEPHAEPGTPPSEPEPDGGG